MRRLGGAGLCVALCLVLAPAASSPPPGATTYSCGGIAPAKDSCFKAFSLDVPMNGTLTVTGVGFTGVVQGQVEDVTAFCGYLLGFQLPAAAQDCVKTSTVSLAAGSHALLADAGPVFGLAGPSGEWLVTLSLTPAS